MHRGNSERTRRSRVGRARLPPLPGKAGQLDAGLPAAKPPGFPGFRGRVLPHLPLTAARSPSLPLLQQMTPPPKQRGCLRAGRLFHGLTWPNCTTSGG